MDDTNLTYDYESDLEINELETEIHTLQSRLKEAEEILGFYANGGNPNQDVWHHERLGYFTGKRALEYFEKWGGPNGE